MTTFDLLRTNRDEVLEVAKSHGVRSVKVFGSVIHGHERPDSDIDLLVTTGTQTSSWFPAGLILDLERLLGRKIDVVTESGLNPVLKEHVLKEAVPL